MEILTDHSPMPVKGPYEGVAMANVPADYLLHLRYKGIADPAVIAYIEENADILENELAQLQDSATSDTEDEDISY